MASTVLSNTHANILGVLLKPYSLQNVKVSYAGIKDDKEQDDKVFTVENSDKGVLLLQFIKQLENALNTVDSEIEMIKYVDSHI